MINVTKPFLPPIDEYLKCLEGIWQRNWLTNNGPLVNELELKLKEYLNAPDLLYLSNGTIALQIAIKALGVRNEVITTPFTYVATTSSIVWEGCTPVFVDIEPHSLNIDPLGIEAAVTDKTTAIIATHVYGNPCQIDVIKSIADRYNLKVIYDGAHSFGTLYKGKSIFCYGDITTASFHATKLFHTVEGGAVFTSNPDVLKKMSFMRNFGHNGPEDFAEVGINGKNSEFHAAMGLTNLRYVAKILESRKLQSQRYDKWLEKYVNERIKIDENAQFNYSYYPLILPSTGQTINVIKELQDHKIFPRRYFYPALNTVGIYQSKPLPVCESIANRIICLPLYFDLSLEEIDFICQIIISGLKY